MLLPVPLQDSSVQSSWVEYEKLLRESQKEVLRLQRQLSVTSSRQRPGLRPDGDGTDECEENAKEAGQEKVKKIIMTHSQFHADPSLQGSYEYSR